MKFLFLIALGVILFRWTAGRWPWQPRISPRQQAISDARRLLGTEGNASRTDIISAHKRLVAKVHPDKGGTNQQVHEANAARDLLLTELPREVPGPDQEPS